MNSMTDLSAVRSQQSAHDGFDGLISHHYDQVYGLCHAFLDDATVCLALTDAAFRNQDADASPAAIFRQAADLILADGDAELPLPSLSFRTNAAWLMKELAGLTYHEIGLALGLTAETVKQTVAEARFAMLEAVA